MNPQIRNGRKVACPYCNNGSKHFQLLSYYYGADVSSGLYGKCWATGKNYIPTTNNDKVTKSPKNQHNSFNDETKKKWLKSNHDFIMQEFGKDNFTKYCIRLFGPPIMEHLQNLNIGCDYQGNTVFTYRNLENEVNHFKSIPYGKNGKRLKKENCPIRMYDKPFEALYGLCVGADNNNQFRYEFNKNTDFNISIPYNLQLLKNGFANYDAIKGEYKEFNPNTPIILVESEKTCVISSFVYPQYIFIATGGVSGLTDDKAKYLKNRIVFILFDNDDPGRLRADATKETLKKYVKKSTIINPRELLEGFKDSDGFDIADMLINYYSNQDNLYDLTERWYLRMEGCNA